MKNQNTNSNEVSPFAPESKNDKDKLPLELSARKNSIDLKKILGDPAGTEYNFKYGDFIPHAEQFNTYLEANITPGKTLKIKQDELISLIKTLTLSMRGGSLSALPMPCMGYDMCIMGSSCPMKLSGIAAPIGNACPIEKSEGLGLARKLASDVGDDRSYTDDMMIQGVVALQMLKRRIYAEMASRPEPTIEVMKGMDPRGNLIMERIENPVYSTLNMVIKNEQTLLKTLMLTYEQRLKKRKKNDESAEKTLTLLRNRLAEVRRDKKAAIIDTEAKPFSKKANEDRQPNQPDANGNSISMATDAGTGMRLAPDYDSLPSTGDINKGIEAVGGEGQGINQEINQGDGDIRKPYIGKSPFNRRS